MPASPVKPGYLLVELVAAVALLSLAVAALLPSLFTRSSSLQRFELIEHLADLDRRARMLSLREGPVHLAIDPKLAMMSAATVHAESALLGVSIQGWELRLLDADNQMEIAGVLIDRLGRSSDYTMLLHDKDSRLALRFDGHTGRVRVEELAP